MNDPRQTDTPTAPEPSEEESGSIKEMFLLAALYLPLGFFLWFWARSLVVFPIARLSEWALTLTFPDVFNVVEQTQHLLTVFTHIPSSADEGGRPIGTSVNPMIYGWGIPLFFGLSMATPLTVKRRVFQCAIGFSLVGLVQVWGVYWESLRDLYFLFPQAEPNVLPVLARMPLSADVVALCYQLGYLMLPAIAPIVAWILLNRVFLERVVLRRAEPNDGPQTL